MVKIYTKYQINVCKHDEKSAENWSAGLTNGRMDRRTECKPIVPFDFVGRGLITECLLRLVAFQYHTLTILHVLTRWMSKSFWLNFSCIFFTLIGSMPLNFITDLTKMSALAKYIGAWNCRILTSSGSTTWNSHQLYYLIRSIFRLNRQPAINASFTK